MFMRGRVLHVCVLSPVSARAEFNDSHCLPMSLIRVRPRQRQTHRFRIRI